MSLVADEVEHPTELVDWLARPELVDLYIDASEPEIQAAFQSLAEWVVAHDTFGTEHVARFLDGADLWIVATVSVVGGTVVTQERAAGLGTTKVKIPDVCSAHGLDCVNTFGMLEGLDAAF